VNENLCIACDQPTDSGICLAGSADEIASLLGRLGFTPELGSAAVAARVIGLTASREQFESMLAGPMTLQFRVCRVCGLEARMPSALAIPGADVPVYEVASF
jgi:hypothetical protein